MSLQSRLADALLTLAARLAPQQLVAVTVRVDDSPGWSSLSNRPHERDQAEIQELYADTLTAWRKNPIAKRITDITSDYVLGDGLHITSTFEPLNEFIKRFWHHRQNRLQLRLPTMVEELSRAGDLFPILFRDPSPDAAGMSYLRFVTKDQIHRIVTAPADWETEIAYIESLPEQPGKTKTWRNPAHPLAQRADAVMMHYSVNLPLGALMGESDLTTMIPWLLRYSRMLEDRVRLNWAIRAFYWVVTVPSAKVNAKREEYKNPPEHGAIIVKDKGEEWEAQTPLLRGADAQHDLTAIRRMIDAGSGFPPHWRGEPENATLATAEAMQAPAERHLRRRQLHTIYMLEDILFIAYNRAREITELPALPNRDYDTLFIPVVPDITRTDNLELARSAHELAQAYRQLTPADPATSPALTHQFVAELFRLMGRPITPQMADEITEELLAPASANASTSAATAKAGDPTRSNGHAI